MKNKNYLQDLNEIQEMARKLRSVNESINFAESYDGEYDMDTDEAPDASIPQEPDEMGQEGSVALRQAPTEEEPSEEDGLREMGDEVDKIREIALRGMVKLCHNIEDPRYDALKKIFSFCDKAKETKDEPAK